MNNCLNTNVSGYLLYLKATENSRQIIVSIQEIIYACSNNYTHYFTLTIDVIHEYIYKRYFYVRMKFF